MLGNIEGDNNTGTALCLKLDLSPDMNWLCDFRYVFLTVVSS